MLLTTFWVCFGATVMISGALADRFGVRLITGAGLAILAFGCYAVSTLSAASSAVDFVLRVAPVALGFGISHSPTNSAVMSSAPRDRLGIASGTITIGWFLGRTAGVAALGAFYLSDVVSPATLFGGMSIVAGPPIGVVTYGGTALGLILMQQDRLPEAVTVLRKRSKRAAGDYMVHWFLAEALHRSGVEPGSEAEAEAVRAVRRSVALNPELFQSRLLLGRMLARRGVFNEAIEHLQKARAIDPTAVAATYQLALVHRSLGDTEQAKELLALVGRQKAEDREQFTKGGLLRIVREGRP